MSQEIKEANISRLPIGVALFETFQKDDLIYVDKSDKITRLVQETRYAFLSRPRRFGKSLLVSTLASFFRNGKGACAGLKAANLWDLPKYPVLTLDFSEISDSSDVKEFRSNFNSLLKEAIENCGLRCPAVRTSDPLIRWRRFLQSLEPSSLVVLIDEYDAPLTAHLHEDDIFRDIKKVISSFFATTKKQSGKLRFLFITGIMKFRQASLFSTFNNIIDISLDPTYGDLLGYTEEEISSYFGPYIVRASKLLNMAPEQVLKNMAEHYDGFCFDNQASIHVYAPWSVLLFLRSPVYPLQHYWFDSAGTTTMLMNYLKKHKLLNPEDFDKPSFAELSDLNNADDIDNLSVEMLLTHVGYLTIKKVNGPEVALGYPNEEVREAFARLYRTAFWPNRADTSSIAAEFREALAHKDAAKVLEALNRLVHSLDYKDFSLQTEAAVRQLLQVFCLGGGIPTRVEVHSALGRSDLEIFLDKINVVFELKVSKTVKSADSLLEKAKTQIIRRDYGTLEPGKELLKLAVVFAVTERKFAKVAILPQLQDAG